MLLTPFRVEGFFSLGFRVVPGLITLRLIGVTYIRLLKGVIDRFISPVVNSY